MSDRDEILARITRAAASLKGGKDCPLFKKRDGHDLQKRWQEILGHNASRVEGLVDRFKEECEELLGKVYLAGTDDEARQLILSIIKEKRTNRIAQWDSPLLKRLKVDHLLEPLEIEIYTPTRLPHLNESKGGQGGDDRKNLIMTVSSAELGITGVDYGLADTGTLVLRSLPVQERSTSLLPPIHLAILESDRILSSLDDLITSLRMGLEENGYLDSCLTLITGPSKTADIELNLVMGVHGPKELHVIILSKF